MCWSPISPSISALGHEGSHRVDDYDIDAAAPHEDLRDLQGLLARIGLRDEEVFRLDPDPARVVHVEGVLCVDEGRRAAVLLHLGDDLEGKRRLAGGLRARISRQRAPVAGRRCPARCRGRWTPSRRPGTSSGGRSPSFMIEPLPKSRSICVTAISIALPFPPSSAFTLPSSLIDSLASKFYLPDRGIYGAARRQRAPVKNEMLDEKRLFLDGRGVPVQKGLRYPPSAECNVGHEAPFVPFYVEAGKPLFNLREYGLRLPDPFLQLAPR